MKWHAKIYKWIFFCFFLLRVRGAEVKFLLMSDTHVNPLSEELNYWQNTNLFLETVSQSGISFDYIILSGDLSNFPGQQSINDTVENARSLQAVGELLTKLGSVAKGGIYWVPGNHDSYTIYQNHTFNIPGNSFNIHNQTTQLRPKLWIAGWGGSVNAFENGTQVWEGFPYLDNELPPYLTSLFSTIPENESVIFVSHNGPLDSCTTVVTTENRNDLDDPILVSPSEYVLSGSQSIRDLISGLQDQLVVNIHGHTHNGYGISNLGRVRIINPGSIRYSSSYGLLTVDFDENSQQWKQKNIELFRFGFGEVDHTDTMLQPSEKGKYFGLGFLAGFMSLLIIGVLAVFFIRAKLAKNEFMRV